MNGSPSSNGSPSNHSFGYGAPALNLGPAIPLNIPYHANFVTASQLEADLKPMAVPKRSSSSTSSQAAAAAAANNDNKRKKRKFPHKLYDMLEHASNYPEWSSAVSWSNDGKSFEINNRDKLIELLPTFFQQTKFRSFTRQLNLWGFSRITPTSWANENFTRGDLSTLDKVTYIKVKGGKKGDGPKKSKLIRLRHKEQGLLVKKGTKNGTNGAASDEDDEVGSLSSKSNNSEDQEPIPMAAAASAVDRCSASPKDMSSTSTTKATGIDSAASSSSNLPALPELKMQEPLEGYPVVHLNRSISEADMLQQHSNHDSSVASAAAASTAEGTDHAYSTYPAFSPRVPHHAHHPHAGMYYPSYHYGQAYMQPLAPGHAGHPMPGLPLYPHHPSYPQDPQQQQVAAFSFPVGMEPLPLQPVQLQEEIEFHPVHQPMRRSTSCSSLNQDSSAVAANATQGSDIMPTAVETLNFMQEFFGPEDNQPNDNQNSMQDVVANNNNGDDEDDMKSISSWTD